MPRTASLGLILLLVLGAAHPAASSLAGCIDYAETMHWIGSIVDEDAQSVVVDDNRVFLGLASSGMRVYDIANPAVPSLEAVIPLLFEARGGRLEGGYLFVAGVDITSASALGVVDIEGPGEYTVVTEIPLGGTAWNLVLSGEVALIASGGAGLLVVDVSDPENPVEIASVNVGGDVRDVSVDGDLAVLADAAGVFHVVDIQNPAAPAVLASLPMPNPLKAVALDAGLAYVAAGGNGEPELHIVDISTPSAPTLRSSLDLPSRGEDVKIADDGTDRVFVLTRTDGLAAVDVSDTFFPVLLGTIPRPDLPTSCEVAGTTAFVCATAGGLQIIDVTGSLGVDPVSSTESEWELCAIDKQDDYLYVGTDNRRLQIFQIADPAQPVDVANYEFNTFIRQLTVDGTWAYVMAQSGGLRVVDVSDPSVPTEVASIDYGFLSVEKAGDYVIATGNDLHIIDVSDPLNPVWVSTHEAGIENAYAWDTCVSGDYVYVAFNHYFEKIDISDKANPSLVDTWYIDDFSWGRAVAVKEGYAYLLDGRAWLHVLDVSSNEISFVSKHELPAPYGEGVEIYGDYAYVTGNRSGIHVFDIRDPENVTAIGGAVTRGKAFRSFVDADYVYVAADSRLEILPVHCSDASTVAGPEPDPRLPVLAFPNPSPGMVRLQVAPRTQGNVRIDILTVEGRRVRRLETVVSKGDPGIFWDGRNEAGRSVAAGTYLLRGRSNGDGFGGRVVILR